jgi:acyl dehydratase
VEKTKKRGTETKITEEMVQELLKEKGIEYRARRQFNEVATKDAIRHWADGIGDLNPLWRDEEYAKKTRYSGIIAPPTWLFSTTTMAGRMGLPGIHGMHSGTDWHFYLPVRLNDRISVTGQLHDLIEKPRSEFAGRSFLQVMRQIYKNQKGEIVAELYTHTIRHERDTAREKGKYKGIVKHIYRDEELEEIWAAIEREEIRGAKPRYWEDVQEGEELPAVVKGPLTVSDIVAFKIGWGNEPFMWANELRYAYMKRHPGTAIRNRLNVPDVPESVHYDDDMAIRVGVPGLYDYGPQRISWLGHLVTNWIGDDGWLKRLNIQVRRHNIEGDTQWCKGKVKQKYCQEQKYLVECEVWCENQRQEVTALGTALVELPSRNK